MVAEYAGFCYGVQQAVSLVESLVAGGEKIATLGPIIHNPFVVEDLERRGVKSISSLEEADGRKVVIRSHGVEKELYHRMEAMGIPYADATCIYVRKIQRIAHKAGDEGKPVLIAGDRNHPEIKGIISHCSAGWHCFTDSQEFVELVKKINDKSIETAKNGYILIAQTTFRQSEWQKCRKIAKNMCTKPIIFDTICNATMLRQSAAEDLARSSDVMVVVGGRSSSNTAKLAQICAEHCRTVAVESAAELRHINFEGAQSIGVTAGASTPAFIIKEVQTTMSEEIVNKQDEMSFEEMLEQSFKTIGSREKVTAIVTNVSPNEIGVDIGTKHAGYVPLNEFTDDANARLDELVKVGDELELMVLRVNDSEGTAMLSKKRLDAIAGFEKVVEAEESGAILEGMVINVVKGGVIALTNGVQVFIPASQATASRSQPLESLLRQNVRFKILETNKNRHRAVASIRAVLREERKELEEKFWTTVEVGNTYTGTVKSLTSYGAFVDLGGVDGMIHISELSWGRIKHPSEVVSVDDVVEVYVKDIDAENKKISLGYKKTEDNPWEILKRDYAAGDEAKVTIVSMTPFGAFAQVIPGVDGLIHISQISNERINKPADVLSIGQEVDVKITDIDFEKKRVSLSIRALMDSSSQDAPAEDAPLVQEFGPPEEAAPLVQEFGPPEEETAAPSEE